MMHTGEGFGYYLIKPNWNWNAPMPAQNVFVFWVTPLFYESISRSLKHPDIKFVGATSNYAAVSADISRKRPSTILIEDAGEQHNRMLSEFLNTFPWAIKIIFLGFNDNKLMVYYHEQRSIAQTDDLLQLILSELV